MRRCRVEGVRRPSDGAGDNVRIGRDAALQGLELRVLGSGFKVWCFRIRVTGVGFRCRDLRCRGLFRGVKVLGLLQGARRPSDGIGDNVRIGGVRHVPGPLQLPFRAEQLLRRLAHLLHRR